MNEKQQQLTFDKGITNVPSDLLCSDNTLEESVGMIYDDGEHRVIQAPKVYINTGRYGETTSAAPKILYIHKFDGKERYIGLRNSQLIWGEKDSAAFVQKGTLISSLTEQEIAALKITSIGKTLIASHLSGFQYFNWKPSEYENIGEIPEPQFEFLIKKAAEPVNEDSSGDPSLTYNKTSIEPDRVIINTASTEEVIYENNGEEPYLKEGRGETYNDIIAGLYAKNKKAISDEKKFTEPFFIRTAIEMYDETYTHISQPILMMPTVRANSFGFYQYQHNSIQLFTDYGELYFLQKTDFSKWSDVIKSLTVFITHGVSPYDTTVDQAEEGKILTQGARFEGVYKLQTNLLDRSTYNYWDGYTGKSLLYVRGKYNAVGYCVKPLKQKSDADILSQLKSSSTFYKIFEVGLKSIDSMVKAADYIEAGTLTNLTTQTFLQEDDYFSRCKMYADFMYAYNSRLNITGVIRTIFDGYHYFMPYDVNNPASYDFYVKIQTDGGDIWVRHTVSAPYYQMQGEYFFYPDARAKHVTIYATRSNVPTCVCDEELTEHPSLNGAYFFGSLPPYSETAKTVGQNGFHIGTGGDTYVTDPKEALPNYIITSEVNNPWVFKAEGYNKVGTGKIFGVAATVMALSQDAYGRTDLIVFSESGVWGMKVDGTGLFQSIHPFSREVCNNPKSITPVDGAVFFSSEKGLMIVTDGGVKCVSAQLSGKENSFAGEIVMGNFRDFLKDCFIAYDYRDSLLWIFNNSRTHVVDGQTVPYNTNYCYVYSFKSGTFGKYNFTNAMANVVNNYPDYLIQDSNGNTFSLLTRDNINLDNTNYSGLMITRPMKLENGLALKSLMQIMHIKQLSSGASMTMQIYASNNVNNWVELHSLRGTPWKYYRFRFNFSNLKAVDRFSGTMVITQERRTDKLR